MNSELKGILFLLLISLIVQGCTTISVPDLESCATVSETTTVCSCKGEFKWE